MSTPTFASSSTTPDYVAHNELWFDDGSIVLLATSPKDDKTIGFRLHAGMLIHHSAKLTEMLRKELGLDDDEALLNVDWTKCELFIKLDDHPVDVEYWLTALYDGLYFTQLEPKKLAILRAVLILSKKYETIILYRVAYNLLLDDYPIHPDGWVEREKRCRTPCGTSWYHPLQVYANPIHAIRLGRELNLPEILAAAFYDLSRWPVAAIQYGTRPLAGGEHIPTGTDSPDIVKINANDYIMVVGLKDWLMRYIREFLKIFVDERSHVQNCEDPTDPNCCYVFTYVLDKVLRMIAGLPGGEKYMRTEKSMVDPLLILERVWIAVRQKQSDIFKVDFKEMSADTEGKLEKTTTVCCRGCAAELRNACFLARNECWFKMSEWVANRKDGDRAPVF